MAAACDLGEGCDVCMSSLVNFGFALGLAESVPNEAAAIECSSFFTGFLFSCHLAKFL